MDQRQVFSNEQELLSIITGIQNEKQVASLLVDKEGLTRIEGIINSIEEKDSVNECTIRINDGEKILLNEIVAINGLFRSDYSEC